MSTSSTQVSVTIRIPQVTLRASHPDEKDRMSVSPLNILIPHTFTFFFFFFGASCSTYTSNPSPDEVANKHAIRASRYRSSRRWLTNPTLTKHFWLTSAELRARARGAGLSRGPNGKRSRAHQVSSEAQATLSDARVSHPREGGGRGVAPPPSPHLSLPPCLPFPPSP